MYLLDTDVISDSFKQHHPKLGVWLNAQDAKNLYISSISLAEIAYGVHLLPDGKRKAELFADLHLIRKRFAERTLAIDAEVALAYGEHQASQIGQGNNDDPFNSLLVATAKRHGLSVVTRNTGHFEGRGIGFVNPYL